MKKVFCPGCGENFVPKVTDQKVCQPSCAELAEALEADELAFRKQLEGRYGNKVFVPPDPDPVFTAPPPKGVPVRRKFGTKLLTKKQRARLKTRRSGGV